MGRALVVVPCVLAVFGVVACASKPPEPTEAPPAPSAPVEPAPTEPAPADSATAAPSAEPPPAEPGAVAPLASVAPPASGAPAPSAEPAPSAAALAPNAAPPPKPAAGASKTAPKAEPKPASTGYAGDDPCTTTNFQFGSTRAACSSGGRKAAKGVMKGAVQQAKAAGTELQCTSCHTDMKSFALKSNAVADLRNWLK